MQIYIKSVDMKAINIKVPTLLIRTFIFLSFKSINIINKLNIIKNDNIRDLLRQLNTLDINEFNNALWYLSKYYKGLVLVDIKTKSGDYIFIKV